MISRRIASLGDWALDASCPIYKHTGGNQPQFLASSVLLAFGDAAFVVTAAHVLDEAKGHDLYVGGGTLVPLSGKYFMTRPPPGGTRAEDTFDLGLFPLSAEDKARLGVCTFIGPHELDPAERTDPTIGTGSYYLLVGFPGSRQPRRMKDGYLEPKQIYFASKSLLPESYAAKGLDMRRHLLLEYQKHDVWAPKGRRDAPDPPGMSGCGVWAVPGLLAPSPPQSAKLVAVAIEWHRESQAILATRIGLLLDLIADEFPGLRHLVPKPPAGAT